MGSRNGDKMAEYAKIIVDISHEKLDKTFDYRIPPYLRERIDVGMQVYIPFGNRRITAKDCDSGQGKEESRSA